MTLNEAIKTITDEIVYILTDNRPTIYLFSSVALNAFKLVWSDMVLPEYQNRGIGKELVRRCIEHFPNSEWLIQTTKEISGFYEKNGFTVNNNVFLTVPCKLFTRDR